MVGISLAPLTFLIKSFTGPTPCSESWWFDRVSKKPSVKADVAIYSRDVLIIGLAII